MIFDDINNVFLINFDDDLIKIRIEQFLNTLTQECIDDLIEININVIKILLKKSKIEIKENDIISNSSISLKLKNLFHRKMSSDVNSTNFFALETSKNEKNLNSDINDHWESKYKKKIRSILMKHKLFFRFDFDHFNDEIFMLVSFRDEKDIERLKQFSYFMSFKDKKTMNEILNFFVTNDQVQKISFKIINFAISSTFVIWWKEKSRVMINLRRINIKLYSNVYSLLKQNTILCFFNDSIVFSSIDFIKEFFQQSINSKNYWKTTFVSQHRELEWLTISSMNLNNISRFF
jgi:predicted transposase YbfD/YdcC